MLVLSRKLGEKIYIGDNICLTITDIDRGKVRIGIEAPRDMTVYRNELLPANHALAVVKKYILFGGMVRSRNDAQEHYISARRLAVLYNLRVEDCILVEMEDQHKLQGVDQTKYVCLHPRFDGKYELVASTAL